MRLRSVGQASRRVRPVRGTRRPGSSGRRPGRRTRDHAARRGRRHGSTPYASIADDSEADRDRPIKCCDDIHSIYHYPSAPATRGREASRGALTIREILTVATFVQCVHTRQRGAQATVSVHFVTRIEVGCYVRGSGSLRQDRGRRSGQVRLERVDVSKEKQMSFGRSCADASDALRRGDWCRRETGKTAGGEWPAVDRAHDSG